MDPETLVAIDIETLDWLLYHELDLISQHWNVICVKWKDYYRYGRWYYGHHHSHGCEFGGNDGSGEPQGR